MYAFFQNDIPRTIILIKIKYFYFYAGLVVAIIRMWASESAPFQQANFLALSVGTVIAPQLFKPFLSSNYINGRDNITQKHLTTNGTSYAHADGMNDSDFTMNGTNDIWKSDFHEGVTGMFAYGYVITAVFLTCGSIINFTIVCLGGCKLKRAHAKSSRTEKGYDQIEGVAKFLVLLLQFFLGFIMSAIEETYAGLLITFLVKYLHLSESSSTDMMTVYFAASAASRGLGIVFAKFIRASRSLAIEVLLIVLGYVLLMCMLHLHWVIPWISAVLIGLGFGAFYPNMINWANSCMNLRGRETSVIFFSVGVGKMTSPFFVGYIFEEYGPKWFVYIGFIYSILLTCVYIAKYVTVKCFTRRLQEARCNELRAMETIIK